MSFKPIAMLCGFRGATNTKQLRTAGVRRTEGTIVQIRKGCVAVHNTLTIIKINGFSIAFSFVSAADLVSSSTNGTFSSYRLSSSLYALLGKTPLSQVANSHLSCGRPYLLLCRSLALRHNKPTCPLHPLSSQEAAFPRHPRFCASS